jgi:hypothetical protein
MLSILLVWDASLNSTTSFESNVSLDSNASLNLNYSLDSDASRHGFLIRIGLLIELFIELLLTMTLICVLERHNCVVLLVLVSAQKNQFCLDFLQKRGKIRFFFDWSHVGIDFYKIPGISPWPDVEFGTGSILVPLRVIVTGCPICSSTILQLKFL